MFRLSRSAIIGLVADTQKEIQRERERTLQLYNLSATYLLIADVDSRNMSRYTITDYCNRFTLCLFG